MRCWSYSYKTPDGLRHEAEMSAATKDDVYAALREKGIRAIRVTERVAPVVRRGFRGLRKRDWSLIAAGLVLLTVVAVAAARTTTRRFAPAEAGEVSVNGASAETSPVADEPQAANLAKAVDAAIENFRESASALDAAVLADYRLLVTSNGEMRIRREIAKGRATADAGRRAVRAAYDLFYSAIPADNADALALAQRRYGEAMDEIDAFAESLDGDECAVELLAANRKAWRVEGGEVKVVDAKLAREFGVFRRVGARKAFSKIPR